MILGLGVVRRLLMELFDGRHLLALLGNLESVGEADDRVSDLVGGEVVETEANPQRGEDRKLEGLAVEEVQETQVGAGLQGQGADQAGDARSIGAHAESGQDHAHPYEGHLPGTGGS